MTTPTPNLKKAPEQKNWAGVLLCAALFSLMVVWAISTAFGVGLNTAVAIFILILFGIAITAFLVGLSPF